MDLEAVCAVVVTFHPEADVVDNLAALRVQVDHLIVVDNGSSLEKLMMLRLARERLGFELIENGDNLGIATALNLGVRRAHALGMEWLLLFDQDSRITEGFTASMLQGFRESVWGERLGILVPQYQDMRLNTSIPQDRARKEGLEAAMTSGSLMRVEIFNKIGLFVDELFIDAVDYEFSLRLRREGYVVDESTEALLLHSPGEPCVIRVGDRRLFQISNYGPVRRYYQERNKIWVIRRYFRDFPYFCLKLMMFSSKDIIKIVLAESNKVQKLRMFARGVGDGLKNRMGKLKPAAQ
jgi:rhamnosyltransferase